MAAQRGHTEVGAVPEGEVIAMALTQAQLAEATGFESGRVSRYWPTIVAALNAEGIGHDNVLIAAAGTLKAELGTYFSPVAEYYPKGVDARTYFEGKYGAGTSVGKRLGNTEPGDGYTFRGRGFIQLTGRSNYTAMANRIGVDVLNYPDRALEAYPAARIFAAYFKDRGVAAAANAGDWRKVRLLVNGGYNGWDAFIGVVNRLGGAVTESPGTSLGLVLALVAGAFLLKLR